MHSGPAVWLLRAGFRWWPFYPGRGWLLRLSRLLLRAPVRYNVGTATRIETGLHEWMDLWTFTCLHERDKPFQRSLQLVRPGGVAVDVGANVGVWSLLAAERHPDVRVHAFEPSPAIAARFERHIALNGVETIVRNVAAVAAENGVAPFFVIDTKNTGASSLFRRRSPAEELSVSVVSLDAYLERAHVDRVDVLKVDAEGAELLVFRGARNLLSGAAAPAVFFEVDPLLCAAAGTTTSDVKQLLVEHGYGIFRWCDGAFSIVGIDDTHIHEDLFALKPRHLDAIRTAAS